MYACLICLPLLITQSSAKEIIFLLICKTIKIHLMSVLSNILYKYNYSIALLNIIYYPKVLFDSSISMDFSIA